MGAIAVKVDAARVTVSLRGFALSLGAKDQLMRIIGLLMMKSVRQTFRDSGSPAGSWPPLSAASRSWRKYSSGHKLLIDTGLLLNSINFAAMGNSVVIGTALGYAGVHQFGFDGTQNVRPYNYIRRQRSRDSFNRHSITNKAGRKQTVTKKAASGIATVSVRGFSRHIRIPARPFLVFRPEDPARIQMATERWTAYAAKQAGLETN